MLDIQFPLLLDGATGTELLKRGMPAGACSELWILEHPQVIIDIQKAYVDSGSDVLMAPTFGANRATLKKYGAESRVKEINEKLVSLSKSAAGPGTLIAGDMAPSGLQPEPYGDASFELMVDIFREQAQALDAAGVDYFSVETQMSTTEARAAVYAVKSVSKKPVSVSFTLGATGKTLFGGDILSAMAVITAMGADIFGINCCGDLELVCSQLQRMYPYSAVPLLAKPNAGLPQRDGDSVIYPITAEEMGTWVPKLISAGASAIGSCCGSDSGHIRSMKNALIPAKPVATNTPVLCSTEREAFILSDISSPADIECTWDIIDDALDAVENGADSLRLDISSEDSLDAFTESAHTLTVPLFLHSTDPSLFEDALRIYNGRAIYSGGLSRERSQKLSEKYGMILQD